MIKSLRRNQRAAISEIQRHWAEGAKSICLVMPTGSGKTFVGATVALDHDRVLWVTHQRELVDQAVDELRSFGDASVATARIRGRSQVPGARVTVVTVQSLLDGELDASHYDLLVLDECHHFAADIWAAVPAAFRARKTLGLTATPERYDGRPLGDIFERLVVGATYSELLADKTIVGWSIFQPDEPLGHDFAMDPVLAWELLGQRKPTFSYFLRVAIAEHYAERFSNELGIGVQCVSHSTTKQDRDSIMAGIRGAQDASKIDMITNVYTMTEGVDAPTVSTVLLARPFGFVGGYIQACGRAGRASPGKTRAVLIDLCGSSLVHGNPFQDWKYSLEGRAIAPRSDRGKEYSGPGPGKEYAEPKNLACGVRLSIESDFAEPMDGLPPEFLPRKNAKRLDRAVRRARKARRCGNEKFIRDINGGLGE